MSDNDVEVFLCSFCEKPIRYAVGKRGCRGKCPACMRPIVLCANREGDVDELLASSWLYRRMRLIRGREEVGPINDTEFLELVRNEVIGITTEVMSPELTKGNWIELGRLKLNVVAERVQQRVAEQQRRARAAARQRKHDEENRVKLKRGIRSAIETGKVSAGHRQAIERFALAAGIPADEVQSAISSQSKQLVREVFEEALDDGILEPREEQEISQLAVSLGVELEFTKSDELRVALCRLAYSLDSNTFQPSNPPTVPFKLAAKEQAFAEADVRWHEIVMLKRPAGVPLGGDNYLKEIGTGTAFLTTKQISMIGALQSKKFLLSSVQRVSRYTDGVLFNRSTGNSVFLQMSLMSQSASQFALIAEHVCSGEPVLGQLPSARFYPEIIEAQLVTEAHPSPSRVAQYSGDPKYTFRVVGEFIGNREAHIQSLHEGDPVVLVREPHNEYDPNAVAVYDLLQHQLGYLKRDVASWFAPVLTRKPEATARVHAFTSSGSLIVGIYL